MRIDFKKQKVRKSKFYKFCESNGADYFETDEEHGVWVIPKKYGRYLVALRLYQNGEVNILKIEESCMNEESLTTHSELFKEEQEWIIQILTMFKKYKGDKY